TGTSRVVIVPHHSCDAEQMHRQEDQIGSCYADPEMYLPEAFIHHSSEHSWKPVIHAGKCSDSGDIVIVKWKCLTTKYVLWSGMSVHAEPRKNPLRLFVTNTEMNSSANSIGVVN